MLSINAADTAGGMMAVVILGLVCGAYGYVAIGHSTWASGLGVTESIGLCLLAGFALLSWSGVAIALIGAFRWWIFLPTALIVAALCRLWPRAAAIPLLRRSILHSLAAVGLLAVGAWMSARPAETFLVLDDSGVYTLAGIHLARSGTLMPEVARYMAPASQVLRYWGPFYWASPTAVNLSIGFMPIPKVWTAIGAWLYGDGGAVWVTSFIALLGVFAFMLFLRRSLGGGVAVTAAAFSLIAFPVMWYSRKLMSEPFAMVAIFGSTFALGLERESNHSARVTVPGATAALLLSSLGMIRFEGWAFAAGVAGSWLMAQWPLFGESGLLVRRPWIVRWVGWTLVTGLIAVALGVLSSLPYYIYHVEHVLTRNVWQTVAGTALALASVVLITRRWRTAVFRVVSTWPAHRVLSLSLIALLVATVFYNMLFVGMTRTGVSFWMLLYLGAPAVTLGLAGMIVLALRKPSAELYAVLMLTAATWAGYTVRPFVTIVHPWAIRRFVPYVIPMIMVGVAVLISAIWHATAGSRARARVMSVLVIMLMIGVIVLTAVPLLRVTWPLLAFREQAGMWDHFLTLDSLYPSDAVLVYDGGSISKHLPQAMELVFGRDVIMCGIACTGEDMQSFEQTLDEISATGQRVFLNIIDGEMVWESSRYSLEHAFSYRVDLPLLSGVRIPPPTPENVNVLSFLVDAYEVVPVTRAAARVLERFEVPLGAGSYPYLISGFYRLETNHEGRPFRWTNEEARIRAPLPQAEEIQVWLELGGWRLPDGSEPEVRISLQGNIAATVQLQDASLHRLSVDVSDAAIRGHEFVEIVISTDTWLPADFGISDDRTLGVQLYGVTIKAEGAE